MLTPRQSIIYSAKTAVITLAILSALYFVGGWALGPYSDSKGHFDGGPPAYAFRLVQPRWLSNPDAWPLAETFTRCAVVGHAVLALGVWWGYRRLKRPNHALQRTRPSHHCCHRSVPCAGSLSLGR
jgi:hypothetical protein